MKVEALLFATRIFHLQEFSALKIRPRLQRWEITVGISGKRVTGYVKKSENKKQDKYNFYRSNDLGLRSLRMILNMQ